MSHTENKTQFLLLFSVLIIAVCGLIYELVAGTLASYLLGDSVTQFSLVIGVYLFSMGIGSFLSAYVNEHLIRWFILIEILVGIVGGFSASLLFITFPLAASFRVILFSLVVIVGVLVGIEIPLLLKILKDKLSFSDLVSRVFTFDYIGALLASIVFPLIFVPKLGLIRTALFFGIFNIAIGLVLAYYFQQKVRAVRSLKMFALVALTAEVFAFAFADRILDYSDALSYDGNVILSRTTHYQRIVLTGKKNNVQLFLNNNLQFSSADEYRYHEALVLPPMSTFGEPASVLILGGGDGLAVKQVLKYSSVKEIQLVDLDPEMTSLFSTMSMLIKLNENALNSDKLKIKNADAFIWLKNVNKKYDCVIIDFPDPSSFSLGKLYSKTFYNLLKRVLYPHSIVVIQSTSPLVAPKSFWCVDRTLRDVDFYTLPYHNYVPSFGEWGYIMASLRPIPALDTFAVATRFINKDVFENMRTFSADMRTAEEPEVNKLNNQALVRYFDEEWSKYE